MELEQPKYDENLIPIPQLTEEQIQEREDWKALSRRRKLFVWLVSAIFVLSALFASQYFIIIYKKHGVEFISGLFQPISKTDRTEINLLIEQLANDAKDLRNSIEKLNSIEKALYSYPKGLSPLLVTDTEFNVEKESSNKNTGLKTMNSVNYAKMIAKMREESKDLDSSFDELRIELEELDGEFILRKKSTHKDTGGKDSEPILLKLTNDNTVRKALDVANEAKHRLEIYEEGFNSLGNILARHKNKLVNDDGQYGKAFKVFTHPINNELLTELIKCLEYKIMIYRYYHEFFNEINNSANRLSSKRYQDLKKMILEYGEDFNFFNQISIKRKMIFNQILN